MYTHIYTYLHLTTAEHAADCLASSHNTIMHINTHICTNIYTHTHIYTHMYSHTHIYIQIYTYETNLLHSSPVQSTRWIAVPYRTTPLRGLAGRCGCGRSCGASLLLLSWLLQPTSTPSSAEGPSQL